MDLKRDGNDKLFEFVYEQVWRDGGDGSGLIGFRMQDYIKAADEFQAWLKEKDRFFNDWRRKDCDGYVVFFNNQESIALTNEEKYENHSFDAVSVLVW
jgi:hypothetical protein